MTVDLPSYPSYRPSGLSWLDRVPTHWEIKRNGQLFSQRKETGFGQLPILEVSLRTGVRVRRFDATARKQVMSDRSKYKRAGKGDVAYNMMRMWQGAVGVAPEDGLVSPAYVVASPFADVEPKYFSELFRTSAYMGEVDAHSRGIVKDRNRLYWEDFKQIFSVCPPPSEQQAIVRFIRHTDRLMARYLRAKQHLLVLLDEQRQTIIKTAITHEHDPSVAHEISGTQRLGHMPEHWELKRLKWVTRLQRGYDLPADQREPGPYPVVSSGGVIDTHSESRCDGPGVVMGRYGSTEAIFYIKQPFWPHNTSLFVTDFFGNDPRWCYYLLSSITKADNAAKSAVPGIDRKDLFQIVVPVPPLAEQLGIAARLDASSQHVVDTTSAVRREIAMAREYRARLITDVATGQLDVREAASNLPDEDGEPDETSLADGILEEGDDADLGMDDTVEEVAG